MVESEPKMKSIWWFVGIMLSGMGAIVLVSGLVRVFKAEYAATVLGTLRPEVWWGGVMIAAGVIFLLTNRTSSADH